MSDTVIKADPGYSIAVVREHKSQGGRRSRLLDHVTIIAWAINEAGDAVPITSDGKCSITDIYFIEQPMDRTYRNAPHSPSKWPARYQDERSVLRFLDRELGTLDGTQVGGVRVA